jgi:DNA/RNA-binding domain of Phe-tRNA-synthetase-like protein
MNRIIIDKNFSTIFPDIRLHYFTCQIQNLNRHENLWGLIQNECKTIKSLYKTADIAKIPAISHGRKAYRKTGNDPVRYRLSAEALLRRILKDQEIYQINAAVDVINLVSIRHSFSTGGYDFDMISGDVVFSIGSKEHYEAIGRGILNIT